jgi:hypothetical protein
MIQWRRQLQGGRDIPWTFCSSVSNSSVLFRVVKLPRHNQGAIPFSSTLLISLQGRHRSLQQNQSDYKSSPKVMALRLTGLASIAARNSGRNFLIIHQPFHQAPYNTSSLAKSSLTPLLLSLSGSVYLVGDVDLIVRDESSEVQGSRRVKAGDVSPSLNLRCGHEFHLGQMRLQVGFGYME